MAVRTGEILGTHMPNILDRGGFIINELTMMTTRVGGEGSLRVHALNDAESESPMYPQTQTAIPITLTTRVVVCGDTMMGCIHDTGGPVAVCMGLDG